MSDNIPDMSNDTTEMNIEGANCSFCLNETLDVLRSQEGVESASVSAVDGCLVVESHDVDQRVLVDIAAANLHGIATWGDEAEMIGIKPTIVQTHCPHRHD